MVNHIKLFPAPHYPPDASPERLGYKTGAEADISYGKHILVEMLQRE